VRLLILGATGPTGRNLVDQALGAGNDVTALVRDPTRITIVHRRLAIVVGDATDPRALDAAVRGKDAVLSALGAGNSLRSDVVYRAVTSLILAMRSRALKRIVFLSAFGVGESLHQASLLQRLAYRTLSRRRAAGDEGHGENQPRRRRRVHARPAWQR
jgi:putative NADH-flavin reductase